MSRSLDPFLAGSDKVHTGPSVLRKKAEDVGKRNERSVRHMQKSAARVDLTVCGVCILDIQVSQSVAGHGFLPGPGKIHALHTMNQHLCGIELKQQCCSPETRSSHMWMDWPWK